MEAPSVPVSHYKSGVTRPAEDNRATASNRTAQAPPAAIDFTLIHAPVRERRAAEAAGRLARVIHPASLQDAIVYSKASVKYPPHPEEPLPAARHVDYSTR